MSFQDFGRTEEQIAGLEAIEKALLNSSSRVSVSPMRVKLAAADLYLYHMGIIGNDQKSLMEVFKAHPKEKYSYVSARVNRTRELMECDVYKHTGISIEAMLEYPPNVVDDYIMLCKEKIKRDANMLIDIKKELDK